MTSQPEPAVDPGQYRAVLGRFPTGVTVVTCIGPDGPAGVAIGSFTSISLDPPLVGFYIGTHSSSVVALRHAGSFCVNVLCEDQLELCGVMASKSDEKFANVNWTPTGTGAPALPDVHATIDCSVDRIEEIGDHLLIVGRVQSLNELRDAPPMVFYKGQYGTFAG